MHNFLKNLLRSYLGWITKHTLLKHQPIVIAVVGNGSTSIAREVIYAALQEGLPGRRNLELPEAEFSVPITALDYPNYPHSVVEWFWLLLKSSLQLWTVRPFAHFLVLEMQPLNAKVLDYWLTITQPRYIVQVGDLSQKLKIKSQKPNIIKLNLDKNKDILAPYIKVAREIAAELHIDELDVDLGLETLDFPEPRLRFWHSTAGGHVIDATYYYFPIRLDSVLEVAKSFGDKFICFTPSAEDKQQLAQLEGWSLNPSHYEPQPDDVILLRGERTRDFPKYKKYLSTSTPFI